jgi:viroplasmin and RNaseH domain-containing protein
MEKKLTKKEMFAKLYSIVENLELNDKNEILGFIDHEVELLEKKASAKGQTKTQKENVGIKGVIVKVLEDNGNPMTITDMLACEELKDYTNQKISALCKQLVDNGDIVKSTDKRKTYFSLAN